MKEFASFYDSRGKLYIDCTECERGLYGSDEDKCSAGWRIKKPNNAGCFLGDLLSTIDSDNLKSLYEETTI